MSIQLRLRPVALACLFGFLAPTSAHSSRRLDDTRVTTARDLSIETERFELPNRLSVVLAPDPAATSVMVRMSLRAGAVFEPPGRSGMAHLVEHLMAAGPTPQTDYEAILEQRRARFFNAFTGPEDMSFDCVLPPEELPVGLWTAADRLGSMLPLIDQALVERHRRVVLEERALRTEDARYGLIDEVLYSRLFPAPHALHGGVGGIPGELALVSADDVRAFVTRLFVPANTTLVVVGRFDSTVARLLVEELFAGLAAGAAAVAPPGGSLPPPSEGVMIERVAREPRVTMAWRIPGLSHADATGLSLGAELLSLLVDGAWGMRVSADVLELEGETVFSMSLTTPDDDLPAAVLKNADGLLRQLTHREMPYDLVVAAHLAFDRRALLSLETLAGRAHVLSDLARRSQRPTVAQELGAHWQLDPVLVHHTARRLLTGPRLLLHARPSRPRPPRPERK